MAYQEIIYIVENNIATITLNRPEAMNALTVLTYQELEQALKEANADDEVRVVIITGAGRGFCSGEDVKHMMLGPNADARRAKRKFLVKGKHIPAVPALTGMDKPLIAAVNGAAVGWGMDLALLCDIRIASDRAKFGEIFILRGLIPDMGGFYFLPLIVGLSKAYELLFTGDIIDAKEAERIGLVSKVVPHDQLIPTAMELATRIAKQPPLAIKMVKEAVRKGLDYHLEALGEYHSYANSILFQTEDHEEGAKAFLEKRPPVFKGK